MQLDPVRRNAYLANGSVKVHVTAAGVTFFDKIHGTQHKPGPTFFQFPKPIPVRGETARASASTKARSAANTCLYCSGAQSGCGTSMIMVSAGLPGRADHHVIVAISIGLNTCSRSGQPAPHRPASHLVGFRVLQVFDRSALPRRIAHVTEWCTAQAKPSSNRIAFRMRSRVFLCHVMVSSVDLENASNQESSRRRHGGAENYLRGFCSRKLNHLCHYALTAWVHSGGSFSARASQPFRSQASAGTLVAISR
jgi:hypothetical protein